MFIKLSESHGAPNPECGQLLPADYFLLVYVIVRLVGELPCMADIQTLVVTTWQFGNFLYFL